jgi:hypothetical protein
MSGQLRDRTDDQLAAGMEDFMDNVMKTSNILKISMTEAAELMKNALDARKLGFLATMPGEKGNELRATLQSLDVSLKSTFGDALGMRLQLGNQQLFAHSQEFKELQATPLGREILPFIEQAAGVYDTKGGKSFDDFMSKEYKGFTDSLIEFMKNPAMKAMSAAGSAQIEWLGEMLPKKEVMSDANAGMPSSSEAIITEMHMIEQKRKAARMSETVINTMMEKQIDNIQRETEARRDLTEEMSKTFENWGPAISIFADAASHLYTWSLGMLEWFITSGFDNHSSITQAIAQENPKLYGQLQAIEATINSNQQDIEPQITELMKALTNDDEATRKAGLIALKSLSETRIEEILKRLPEYEALLQNAVDAKASQEMIDAIKDSNKRTERLLHDFRSILNL